MRDIQPRGWRLTANYALIQSTFNMAYCCIFSFAAVFLLSRGFSNSEVGLTLTIASGLAIACQPFIAAFADKTRRLALRQIVAGLLLVSFLVTLLLTVTADLLLLTAILYILLICAFSSQGSLITSMSMEHINAGVPINFSLARGIGSFAFAVLALVLGSLTNQYGGGIVLPVGMGVSLVGMLLVSTFPKAARLVAGGSEAAAEQAVGFAEFARRNRRFIALISSIALLYFSHVLINTYTIQIVEHVGGTRVDMGIASAIGGFLELPAMALFSLLMRWIPNAGMILKWSGVFLVLKTLITLLAPNVEWIYVAQSLQFFAFAMFVPASVYYVNQVIRGADKVKGQAGMTIALSISGMIGNFLGGILLDSSGGVSFMLAVGLGVSLAGLVLVLLLTERPTTRRICSSGATQMSEH
jgi:MFS transporter, PPP family, 3-phenylpropionic acid transporter